MRTVSVLLGLGIVGLGPAVVATKSTTVPTPLDYTYRWVGTHNGASAVAIGPRTFITARHTGEGAVSLFGETYNQVTAHRPPNAPIPGSATGETSKVDLILINVDRDLPGYYRLARSARMSEAAVMVGYGASGRVLGGRDRYGITVAQGERRAGPARVDRRVFQNGLGWAIESDLAGAGRGYVLSGDSGGGLFIKSRLAGTLSYNVNYSYTSSTTPPLYPDLGFPQLNTAGVADGNGQLYILPGKPYCASGAIDLTRPEIRSWIASVSFQPPAP